MNNKPAKMDELDALGIAHDRSILAYRAERHILTVVTRLLRQETQIRNDPMRVLPTMLNIEPQGIKGLIASKSATCGVCYVIDKSNTNPNLIFWDVTLDAYSEMYADLMAELYPNCETSVLHPVPSGDRKTSGRDAYYLHRGKDKREFRANYMWGWSLYAQRRWDYIKWLQMKLKKAVLFGVSEHGCNGVL